MIIRYSDKDGKEHKINLTNKRPVFICSEIGNTGKTTEIRIEELLRFNKTSERYETSGCFHISPVTPESRPLGIVPSDFSGELIVGPVKQM